VPFGLKGKLKRGWHCLGMLRVGAACAGLSFTSTPRASHALSSPIHAEVQRRPRHVSSTGPLREASSRAHLNSISAVAEPAGCGAPFAAATVVVTLAALQHRRRLTLHQQRRLSQRRAVETAVAGSAGSSPGLLLLEHLNLNVLNTEVALRFYEALGCARDARRPMHKTLHNNCGALTQFHTPSPANEAFIAGSGAQRWRGEIELLYEDAASVSKAAERVRALLGNGDFAGTELSVSQGAGERVTVTDPYGNAFVLCVAEAQRKAELGPASGARPGSECCECVGLGSATLLVPTGCAAPGARFYASVLGFTTEELAPDRWAVTGGPGGASQRLILQEDPEATGKEIGEHVAIYIGDFEGCFTRLLDRGLIFVNPRFEHLDRSTTLEEALHYSCFRFKDIVDVTSGEKLFELEHEVRSKAHKSCPLKVIGA